MKNIPLLCTEGRILFTQNGKLHDLNRLPDGFIIHGSINLAGMGLKKLPDLSKVVIDGDFDCRNNELTSLIGSPKKVKGDFVCTGNKLLNLKGISSEIDGSLNCAMNTINNISSFPKKIGGLFICFGNPLPDYIRATGLLGQSFFLNR